MLPQTQARKPRNSSKVNLIISVTFHGLIIVALVYFAAREGLLGKTIRKIAVEMVKEKPAEKKPEPEKPKPEPPKVETPKVVQAPKIEAPKETAEAPPSMAPAAAPAAVEMPSFSFEGGKEVQTSSDPGQIYKGLVEYSLRSRWNRPEDIDDHAYVAEVEVSVDHSGQITDPVWKKGSGDKRWDDSVRMAIAATKGVDHAPPKNFPSHVLIRFDVQQSEPVVQ
jgi:hypothetical protein